MNIDATLRDLRSQLEEYLKQIASILRELQRALKTAQQWSAEHFELLYAIVAGVFGLIAIIMFLFCSPSNLIIAIRGNLWNFCEGLVGLNALSLTDPLFWNNLMGVSFLFMSNVFWIGSGISLWFGAGLLFGAVSPMLAILLPACACWNYVIADGYALYKAWLQGKELSKETLDLLSSALTATGFTLFAVTTVLMSAAVLTNPLTIGVIVIIGIGCIAAAAIYAGYSALITAKRFLASDAGQERLHSIHNTLNSAIAYITGTATSPSSEQKPTQLSAISQAFFAIPANYPKNVPMYPMRSYSPS